MLNRLTLLKHAPVSSPLAKPRPLPHRAARGSPLRHAVDAVATGIRWWWSRRMARCSCDAAGSLVTLSLWVTPKKISHIWAIYWFKLTHILDIYNILKIILDGGDDITLGWHLFFRPFTTAVLTIGPRVAPNHWLPAPLAPLAQQQLPQSEASCGQGHRTTQTHSSYLVVGQNFLSIGKRYSRLIQWHLGEDAISPGREPMWESHPRVNPLEIGNWMILYLYYI